MDLQLKDKKCLVQSASKGIGLGLAQALANEGAHVTISSSNADNLSSAAKLIENATGQKVDTLVLNNFESKQFEANLSAFLKEKGGVDILIVNSPGPKAVSCDQLNFEDLDLAIQSNLKAAILSCQLTLPYMKSRGWGRVLHVSSTTAREPDEGMVLSNLTRAGVISYAKTLAREYGPFGITVNSILTGGVKTERMVELCRKDAEANGVSLETVLDQVNQIFPVRFVPEPLQFAQNFLFLCSPMASFINGVNFPVVDDTSETL